MNRLFFIFCIVCCFPSQCLAVAMLQLADEHYQFEGGAVFHDGQVRSESFSGQLFPSLFNSPLELSAKGSRDNEYNEQYGHKGFSEYRYQNQGTTQALNQIVGLELIGTSGSAPGDYGFARWLGNITFDVLHDNALLDITLLAGTGSGQISLFDMTAGRLIAQLDTRTRSSPAHFLNATLQHHHSYRLTTLLENRSPGDGSEIELYSRFDNARIAVPAPGHTALLFSFLLVAMLRHTRLKKQTRRYPEPSDILQKASYPYAR